LGRNIPGRPVALVQAGRETAGAARPIGWVIDDLIADVPGEVLDWLPVDDDARHTTQTEL